MTGSLTAVTGELQTQNHFSPMESRKHVMVIAFPGYGHLIPLLSFARKAAQYHHVTYAISKCKINDLRTRELITPEDEKTISLIGLEDGIPDGEGEDTFPGVWGRLHDGIIPSVEELVSAVPTRTDPSHQSRYLITRPVDVVFCELFLAYAAVICEQRSIPCYLFCTGPMGAELPRLTVSDDTPVCEPEQKESPFKYTLGKKALDEGEKKKPWLARHKKHGLSIASGFKPAVGMVINSLRELEQEMIVEFLKDDRVKHYDVKCVGPLVPHEDAISTPNFQVQQQVQDWLDQKPLSSVIYIAFGSVKIPNKERITEIGKALLLLSQPFIFSLRREQHDLLPEEIRGGVDNQFADPTTLGLVLPWAPQRIILNHPATRVFLSHCGWNSTIEAMFAGKPVVSWPIFGDQLYNGQLLEKAGMGEVLIGQDTYNREIPAEEIAQMLATVGGFSYESEDLYLLETKFVRAAREWKKKTRDAVGPGGSSATEFSELMELNVLRL